ncbi:MAG: ABC transporter substrate-binding protein [Chloroflexi bacterium]|nr:ABC transporter substrate-binding protein [Chloroflexota bacterium]
MRKRWIERGVLGALLVGLLVSLSGGGAPRASAAPAPPQAPAAVLPQLQQVKIGDVAASSAVGVYLAQDRGYFQEQGLNAEFLRFDSGSLTVAPLSVGELDVGVGVVSAALFNAIGRGVDVRLVAPQSRYELGYSQLILDLRRDLADSGAIRDFADLRGRTIAVLSLASTNELVMERALQQGGLTVNDVNLVPLGSGDQITAFANGSIDAGLLTEPQATVAADRGVAVKWREAAEWSPGVQVSNILYGPNFTQRNVDAGQRFMLAYLKGVRDYYDAIIAGRGDREAVIATLMRYTPLQDRALYDRILFVYIDPNLAFNEGDLRATIQWHLDRGLIERPVDLSTVIDGRFVQHALSVLGRYP